MSAFPPDVEAIPPEIRERIRLGILQLQLAGAKVPGQRDVREVAKVDQRKNAKVMRAFKAGTLPDVRSSWGSQGRARPESQEEDGESVDEYRAELAEMILEATDDESRERVQHEVARLVALGRISPSEAREIRGPLAEARASAAEVRKAPKDSAERFVLLSEAGLDLADAFERLVSDDRREMVLAFAAELLEEDLEDLPSVDPVGVL